MALELSASRTYPVALDTAYADTLAVPLPSVLGRRYLLVPGVSDVRGQAAAWGDVGQSRTIVTSDGGTMRETLTSVERPSVFTYRLDEITGVFAKLVTGVQGRWAFETAGTGTRITWGWSVEPRGAVGAAAMPLFGRMWDGYARQALAELERVLVG